MNFCIHADIHRRLYISTLLLIFSIILPGLSSAVPRVALYGFIQHGDPGSQQHASIISSLLLEKLSTENEIDLLDRSLILDVFDEKTLTASLATTTSNAPDFEKIPPSDYIIVGSLITNDTDRTLTAELIDVESSEIVYKFNAPVDLSGIDGTVTDLAHNIISTLASLENTRPSRLRLAVTSFTDNNAPLSESRGIMASNAFISRYMKEPNIQMLSRSQMYPLFLEAYFRALQYGNPSLPTKRSSAEILIQGDYTKNNDEIELVLTINVFNKAKIIKSFRDKTWAHIQTRAYAYIDQLLLINSTSIPIVKNYGAELLYRQATNLSEFKLGYVDQYKGTLWEFPYLHWSPHQEAVSSKIITLLNKAIELNPRHYKARLVLAYYLLHINNSDEALANKHLYWLLIQSEKDPVQKIAFRMLHDFYINESAFSDVLNGNKIKSRKLFRALIDKKYISQKGEKLYLFDGLSSPLQLPFTDLTNGQKSEIHNIIAQTKPYPGVVRTQSQAVLDNQVITPEAQLYLNIADRLGKFQATSYGRNLPRITISEDIFKAGNLVTLRNIVNKLASVLYLDMNMDIAKVYLATCMKRMGGLYKHHAELLNTSIMYTAKTDKIRFLTVNNAEDVSRIHFSQNFMKYLRNSDIFVEKHRSQLLAAKKQYRDTPTNKSRTNLVNKYQLAISEGCEFYKMQRLDKRITGRWDRFFDWIIHDLEGADHELTKEIGRQKLIKAFIETRCPTTEVVDDNKVSKSQPVHSKEPMPTNLVITENNASTQQPVDVASTKINYAEPILNIEEIKLKPFILNGEPTIYSLHSTMFGLDNNLLVTSSLGRRKSGYLTIHRRNNGSWHEEQSISKRGNAYPRNLAHATLDIHGNYLIIGAMYEDTNVSLKADNFDNWNLQSSHEPEKLISMLFERGYLDVFSRITPKFTGKLTDFSSDFPELKQSDAQSLLGVIRTSIKVKDVGAGYVFRLNEAGQWQPDGVLSPLDGFKDGNFGVNVAIHDKIAVVCSTGVSQQRLMDSQLKGAGGAYLFIRDDTGWHQQAKLASGRCISALITRQHVFTTQKHYDEGFSEVHIFKRTGNNVELQKTISSKSVTEHSLTLGFGASLAANQHFLIIGEPSGSSSDFGKFYNTAGAVYIYSYDKDDWILQQKLVVDAAYKKGNKFAEFGAALALDDNSLLVGAPGKSHDTGRQQDAFGEAYLYRLTKDGWTLSKVINAAESAPYDRFGASVDISNSALAIGAIRKDGKGKLYVEDRKNR